MKEKLLKLKEDLNALHSYVWNLQMNFNKDEIRSYYKFQNEETNSLSSNLNYIMNDSLISEIDQAIDDVNNLIEYEEDQECDCDE